MIDGRYFPPGQSRAIPARISGNRLAVVLEAEGEAPRRLDLVSVTEPLGSVPRKFNFSDGSVFEAASGANVDAFMGSGASFFARLTRLEGHRGFVVVAVFLTIPAVAGFPRWGLPAVAWGASEVTPGVVLEAMDYGATDTVDRVFFSPSALTPQRQQELRAMFDELATISGQVSPPLSLHFRASPVIGPNAFALPGGTVILTDELVEIARHDDEIAGVLAHEIGHVQGRHGLRQIYQALGLAMMITVVVGDASQLIDNVVAQASALQTIAYTRAFEADADARSVAIMVKAGRNPVAFVDLLDRIVSDMAKRGMGDEASGKKTGWLSTHPGTQDRRAEVERLARQSGWK